MGNLTLVSWETSVALVCGQLFAPQSNVPSEMHECLCARDDQIQEESRRPQNSDVMWYLSFSTPAGNILLVLFPQGGQKSGSVTQLNSEYKSSQRFDMLLKGTSAVAWSRVHCLKVFFFYTMPLNLDFFLLCAEGCLFMWLIITFNCTFLFASIFLPSYFVCKSISNFYGTSVSCPIVPKVRE